MTLNIQAPSFGPPINIRNDTKVAYLIGDNDTDGSIRLEYTIGEREPHIEKRENGVWNDTGLRLASSSLALGLDMTVSAVAGFIETNNPSATAGHIRGLIPHILFDDDGTKQTHTPILKEEEISVVYGTAVSEIINTVIGISLGNISSRVIEHSFHQVGSISSTLPVNVKFFIGTDNTGFLFNSKVLPANSMAANTQLDIDYDNDLGIEGGSSIFMEFSSAANISLKTDISGNPLVTHEMHELAELNIYTENQMLDPNLGTMFDQNLDPIYMRQFS